MALTEAEIRRIAETTAETVVAKNAGLHGACRDSCVSAGMSLQRAAKETPVVWPSNVAGLVRADSLKVPHSELAMHVRAAGRNVLAWSIVEKGRYAHIVHATPEGCCGYTHGLSTEVLNPEIVRVTGEMLGGKTSSGTTGSSHTNGKLTRDDVRVEVWEERDRLHIGIQDEETGEYIVSWWDDEAQQMFVDGFFQRGRGLKESVLVYAEEQGLLA